MSHRFGNFGIPGAYGVYTTSTTQGWLEVAGGIVGSNP